MTTERKQWVSWEEFNALFPGLTPYAVIDFQRVGGLTPGSIPFADADGLLTENNAGLSWDDTLNVLEVLAPTKNTFIGKGVVGAGSSTGGYNVYLGYEVGYDNENGNQNVLIGYWAGYKNTDGQQNTMVGYYAGQQTTTSNMNTCIGAFAGNKVSTGTGMNTLIGMNAGSLITTGYENVAVGKECGDTITDGYRNTFIGAHATGFDSDSHYRIAIGYQASSKEDNLCVIGGATAATSVNVAIFYNREFRFYDDGDNYVGFKAPALGANTIWVLPAGDGGAGEAIVTDGAKNLSFAAVSSTFLGLSDTPGAFAGHGNETLRVNFAEDAIEFYVQQDKYVAVDGIAAPGYLGVAAGDGVLRTGANITVADGGNFITLDTVQNIGVGDSPTFDDLTISNPVNIYALSHDSFADYAANQHRVWEDSIAQDIHADNISEGSVTQHVGAIDHDALLNTHANPYKLDDLAAPDDNTDLDFSTTKHGLCPKGTDVGHFLKDDGTWAAAGVATFLGLTDTPGAYAGEAGKVVVVNAVPDALEFVDTLTLAGLTVTDYIYFDKDVEHVALFGFECGKNLAGGGTYNFFAGEQAGYRNTTGDFNVAIGYQSLFYNRTLGQNVAIGFQALLGLAIGDTAYSQNVGIGFEAGEWIKSGATGNFLLGVQAGRNIQNASYCVFIGGVAGYYQRGNENIAIGNQAMRGVGDSTAGFNINIGSHSGYDTVTGAAYNINIGHSAGWFTEAGDSNICIGYRAGQGVNGSSHYYNILIGTDAGKVVSTAGSCVMIGYQVGLTVTSGGDHVLLGEKAGASLTTHTACVMIGHEAGQNATASNVLYIANSNTATPLIYGEFDTPLLKVTGEFDVVGASKLGDGGITNYAETKADGEINLHGTARVIKQIYLNNAAFTKGGTAPTQVILGNLNAWGFDIGDDAVMTVMLPSDWAAGTDITIKVCWYIDEAYAVDKEVQWRIDWSALPHDFSEAVDAPTHSGQIDSGDIDIPAVAKRMGASTIGTIAAANLSAHDMLGFTLSRIAVTNDDPTADPAIHHLIIEYIADKLGTAT